MRKIFFLLLAVVTALTVTTGVADARGGHGGGHSISCTPASGASTCNPTLPNGHQLPSCTVVAGATTCSDNFGGFDGRNGFGGSFGNGLDRRGPIGPRWPYPGLPGGFPQALNGNLLSLQLLGLGVNDSVNVCMYPSFQRFDAFAGPHYGSGWSLARGRWFRPDQAAAEWLALQQIAGCGGSVVVPGGLSGFGGMLNGSYLNLSQYGVNGYSQLNNLCTYGSWDGFANTLRPRLGGHWNGLQNRFGRDRGMWNSSFSQLRSQVGCGTIVAPISQPVVPVMPVPDPSPVVSAPTTTVEAAPAPSEDSGPVTTPAPDSDGKIIVVPEGPPKAGDSGLAPNAVWVG